MTKRPTSPCHGQVLHTIKGRRLKECSAAQLEKELQVMAVFSQPTRAQAARIQAIRKALMRQGSA